MRYFLFFMGLFLFNPIARADCTIDGSSLGLYDFQLLVGVKMSSEYQEHTIDCDGPTVLRFNPKVEPDIKANMKFLQDELPANYPVLNITVDITPLFGGTAHYFRKRWFFLGNKYQDFVTISGADVATLPKGQYRLRIENVNPDYRPMSKVPYYPWPVSRQELFTLGSATYIYNQMTITSAEDLCTSDSYQITTLPSSTIDFGELGRQDLNNGQAFSEDFTVDIRRVPGDECYELVYPDIEFHSDLPLSGNTDILLENGLLLTIKNSNDQPILFGERLNIGKMRATTKSLQGNFKGVIRKNPQERVKMGPFNAIVRYIVHMR